MGKIKSGIIRFLGGYDSRDVIGMKKEYVSENIRYMEEELYGKGSDEWCDLMYRKMKDDFEELENQETKGVHEGKTISKGGLTGGLMAFLCILVLGSFKFDAGNGCKADVREVQLNGHTYVVATGTGVTECSVSVVHSESCRCLKR